jgi:hypothetical protein
MLAAQEIPSSPPDKFTGSSELIVCALSALRERRGGGDGWSGPAVFTRIADADRLRAEANKNLPETFVADALSE